MKQGHQGALATDYYGRALPKHSHGSYKFERYTDLQSRLFKGFKEIYQRQLNPKMLIRKITVVANDVMPAKEADRVQVSQQLDLFADFTQAKTSKSRAHPAMPRAERAAQFMPFVALTGYEELLAQKAEVRSSQRILASDEQEALAQALVQVKEDLPVKVRVNYYNRKKEKEVELIGTAEKVSELEQTLLVSEQKLDFGQLYCVEILE
ncbi:hypothetical protein L1O48_03655 [Ligilactobacillus equi]|uniref:hypothetical protein n=1 Tax=Ligilactobacillus equi TaxID=137357 RepID=UPI002ED66339